MTPPQVMAYVLTKNWNAELHDLHREATFRRMRCENAAYHLSDGERVFRCTAEFKGSKVVFDVVGDGTPIAWEGPQ